jgi:hypothetical protein
LGGSAAEIFYASVDGNRTIKGILAGNIVINFLMSSALNFLWGMINGLQILAIMPLVDCKTPGNAQLLYMQIYNIASFNLIDVSVLTAKISYQLDLKEN